MPQYAEAVESLYARGHELAPKKDGAPRRKFELDHMRTLAREVGDPQKSFRSILIAGTNGKGSTSATLAHILAADGRRVGLYTSPHLVRVNERVRVADASGMLQEIGDDLFAELYFKVDDAAARLVERGELPHQPSFFEVMTAIAFLAFQRAGVEIAVLEVGLGGRLDATNIVEPELSIITDLALDHIEWLGDTLTLIAREKAGILRQNGTLITLPQHPEANSALGEVAVSLNVKGINAAAYMPTRDVVVRPSAREEENVATYEAVVERNRYPIIVRGEQLDVESPLTGEHQQRNIALAIAAAVALDVPNAAIAKGIRNTQWAGRLQRLQVQGHTVVLDVAHNPAGAWALRGALANIPSPRTLLFSALADKAFGEMAQILFPLFDERDGDRILLAPMNNPRAATREQLEAVAKEMEAPAVAFDSVEEAWKAALAGDATVVVAGSVYLVGAVLPLAQG